MTHYLFKFVRFCYISLRHRMIRSYHAFFKDVKMTSVEEGAKHEREVLGSLSIPLYDAFICPHDSIYNGKMASYCPCCGSHNGARLTDIGLLPIEPNELLLKRRQMLLSHLRGTANARMKLRLVPDKDNARNIA